MDDSDLADLTDSISRNGLREAIMLRPDGSVLDGRNRLRACVRAGVEPRFVEFIGTDRDALEFVIDTNSHRSPSGSPSRTNMSAGLAQRGRT